MSRLVNLCKLVLCRGWKGGIGGLQVQEGGVEVALQ